MKKWHKNIVDTVKMLGALAGGFLLCLVIGTKYNAEALAPAIMVMAVFFIARMTDGMIYGIVASFLSVLAINFAFAFPYFAFNFSIPENIISGSHP